MTETTRPSPPGGDLPFTEQAFDSIPFPMAVYRLDGAMVMANRGLEELFGFPRGAVIGVYNVFADPSAGENGMRDAFEQARGGSSATLQPIFFDLSLYPDSKRSGQFWFAGTLFPVRNANGTIGYVASLYQDITSQMEAKQEQARLAARLEEQAYERLALQDQIIATQQAALRELSTPLIPLTEGIVLMPLIGAIDSSRAQRIMETLLEGIAFYQAETAILDISGVRVVDTQVADALLRAAKAAKLLGTQVFLTGISPEVAQTITHLGADMQDIRTLANLQAALQLMVSGMLAR